MSIEVSNFCGGIVWNFLRRSFDVTYSHIAFLDRQDFNLSAFESIKQFMFVI